jgi:endonuclease/exonuclease/phosphatase family metal-dependent hydrolase
MYRNHLKTNDVLKMGQYLVSPSDKRCLTLDGSGHLHIFNSPPPGNPGSVVWSSVHGSAPPKQCYAVMQGDGNFCIYEGVEPGNPAGQHRWIWDTGPHAARDGYVAAVDDTANFTISSGPADDASRQRLCWGARRRLRVLTYNTHLIEGSNLEAGASLSGDKPVVFQDTTRRAYIRQRIIDLKADIVALQEVWAGAWMDWFVRELHQFYPHIYFGDKGAITAGSGIMLFSKHPIDDKQFVEFRGADDGNERMATKGALAVTVRMPEGVNIRVGNTHAWTSGGGDNCTNIKDLLGLTSTGSPGHKSLGAIMMGDFNIHRKRSPKFATQTAIMASGGATDSWVTVHGSDKVEESFTDDQRNNTLSKFFSPKRSTEPADCIDYAYLKSGDGTSLRPYNASVLRDWSYDGGHITPYWYWVHDGAVSYAPSVTTFRNKLFVAYRNPGRKGVRDGLLQVAIYDPATKCWTHRTIKRNKDEDVLCSGAPSIVAMDRGILLFFAVQSTVFVVESDGEMFGSPREAGPDIITSGGVCAVAHKGSIYLFVRFSVHDMVHYHKWTDGQWQPRKSILMTTAHDISAASNGHTICVMTKDNSGRHTGGVMRATLGPDDVFSQGYQIGRGVEATGSPGVMVAGDKFHVFFREVDGGGIMHFSSPDSIAWAPDTGTGQATTDTVCGIEYQGKIMLFYPFVVNASDNLTYPQRALAHGYVPPGNVKIDMSDHYPYMVDLVY